MNFFDDYYSESQPQQEQTNYIPQEELLEPASPVEPKPRMGLRRIVCAVVALALVASSCGITAGLMNRRFEKELQILNKQVETTAELVLETGVQNQVGQIVGAPLPRPHSKSSPQIQSRIREVMISLLISTVT